MSVDLIARGIASRTVARLRSSQANEGAALVGYRPDLPAAIGRTAQNKLQDIISVRDFGAVGDGLADDTVAIQAAIDAVIPIGSSLFLPIGTYRLSDKLVIPFGTGWRIEGAGQYATTLVQHSANTRIFSFEANLTHSWEIANLGLSWNTPQPAINSNAVAVYFGTGTAGHSIFNWQIRRCNFSNGFRAIAAAATASPAIWGVRVQDCLFNTTMSGAAFFAVPSPGIGQPNICIENCVLNGNSAHEELIRIASGDNVLLRNLEFLSGAAPVQLMAISNTPRLTILGCKSEAFTVGAADIALWRLAQCNATLIGCSVSGLIGTGGVARFVRADAGSTLSIIGMTCSSAMSAGLALAYTADVLPFVADIKLSDNFTDNIRALMGPTVPVPKFNADRRQMDALTDIGNASTTLTAASDRLQYANVTLTANRTVTLPGGGLYDGMEFEIIRRAATPGAFTLQVIDPISAVNHSFAANVNGFVRYRAQGGSWRKLAAGVL